MTESYRKRLWVAALALAVLGAAAIAWWLLRNPVPYSLHKTSGVKVSVRAVKSDYPDVEETADDVELLVKVYVQRLQAGDATDLARIGAPWYTGQERAAQKLITRYGAHAGEPVEAVVLDRGVPYLTSVKLRYNSGQKQTLELTRDHHDVWWVQLGNGDPMAP
ncbi:MULTISPECIES: hypothetical protein [Streptomyces]|uniref:hypothetical protein n=1 Tax=Streptomyces herbicida TaxID=3065675 RepID=UPI00293003FF|nr:hypothetical protein [Streptomyces sp. NEAU-HV9]